MTSNESNPLSSKMRPTAPPFWLPLAVCLGILGLVLWQSPNFGQHNNQVGSPIAGDFLQEWIGGYALRTGGPDALFDHHHLKQLQHDESLLGFRWTENEYFAMVYPPFYYMFWVPFSFLPYAIAAWLFIFSMIAFFLGSHFLMLRCLRSIEENGGGRRRSTDLNHYLPWLLVAGAIYVPVIRSITTGQKGTFCLFVLAVAFFLYLNSRRFASGLTFGLMAFKPQLALPIGISMLARRQWGFVIGSLLVVGVFVGMCFSLGGETCVRYTQFCLGAGDYVETSGYDLYKSHCLFGFLSMLGGGESTWHTKISWLISVGLIGVLLVRLNFQIRDLPRSTRRTIEFSCLVLATLLATPHLFSYDLTLLLLPMYLLVGLMGQQVFSRFQTIKIATLLVALFVVSGFSHVVAALYGLQLTTLLMMALLWVLCWEKPGFEKQPVDAPNELNALGKNQA